MHIAAWAKAPPWAYRLLMVGALIALAVVAARQVPTRKPQNAPLEFQPTRVMGTSCRLVVVPPRETETDPRQALRDAEAALRQVESQMSTWIDASPISRFNQAPSGRLTPLPTPVFDVLNRSRELHAATEGAFDITCRPLIELWRAAGTSGSAPTPSDIETARRASSWEALTVEAGGATKALDTVRVDLGGIAKGYGIDRATSALRLAGMVGGLVDVGGDVRVFGTQPNGKPWEVQLRDPRGEGIVTTLRLREGAICTSGDYFRFIEVEGQRLSHIVDPRTGRPARGVRSATVVASDTMTADAWATALSVLGEGGLAKLPRGIEALLILGESSALRAVATRGVRDLLVSELPFPTAYRDRPSPPDAAAQGAD